MGNVNDISDVLANLRSKCSVTKDEKAHDATKIVKQSEEEEENLAERKARSDAKYYKGEFDSEKRKCGTGTWTYEHEDTVLGTYEGQWLNDKAHGTGVYTTPHAVYKGDWIEDLKHGEGQETYHEEHGDDRVAVTKYEGQFRAGYRQGKGKITWPDGSGYEGEFLMNNLEGKGTFTWKNGQKYSGEVKDNHIDGNGRYEWPDGTAYEGQYKMGVKDGEGKFLLKSGNVMKCHWRGGKPFGSVTFHGCVKELNPPVVDWYDGVMVAWAVRSEEPTPRDGQSSGRHKKKNDLFSPRRTSSKGSGAHNASQSFA